MHAAGLTNGSFYSHFTSKEALLLGALEGAFNESEKIYHRVGDNLPPRQALTRFIDFYLSTYHRDSPSNCPIITLVSYLPRQSKKFRGTFDAGLKATSRHPRGLAGGRRHFRCEEGGRGHAFVDGGYDGGRTCSFR